VDESVIKLKPRNVLAYILLSLGLILLAYVTFNCIWIAQGTLLPLKINNPILGGAEITLGIILQVAMFSLLIAIGAILLKTSVNLLKT
jgi:hypothetical protein